jgi:predicted DsbA family dithiol-disulfide isomerase
MQPCRKDTTLEQEMARARGMGVDSFPALVLDCSGSRWGIPVEYTDPAAMLETIGLLL